jgi:hypothetical protein
MRWVKQRRAGVSNLELFRAQRWRTLRRDWRNWAKLLAFLVATAIAVAFTHGTPQLVFAALVGSTLTMLAFGWMLGGDVHSLTWIWGRIGEQQTEAQLDTLDREWRIEHDIRNRRGNWDHLVVGRAGLFLLDSKRLHGQAHAAGDALRAGRSRFPGAGFRGAAVELGDTLLPILGRRPWVNSVVVVWDNFPQGIYQEDRVTYIAGERLPTWLSSQPATISPQRRDQIAAALAALRTRHQPETVPATVEQ